MVFLFQEQLESEVRLRLPDLAKPLFLFFPHTYKVDSFLLTLPKGAIVPDDESYST